ncbi:MAG: NADH-quinone oxidoreductase subunit NuoN [Micavibrio sp.]|nr:NADH-quinone oxidoreductase subunit NuoN [Micavibrio sp.]
MLDFNLIPLIPEIFMAIIAMGLLIVGVFNGNDSTRVVSWAAAAGLGIAALLLMGLDWQQTFVMSGMFTFDKFAGLLKLMILLGLIISIALSVRFIKQEGMERFEYPILILFAGLGMMIMVSANNFLTLYMGLELQSLSLYVLAAFYRNSRKSAEAGIKYFLLGALSSGLLLFGISLIYGFSGTLDYSMLGNALDGMESIPVGITFGMVFILAGLAFKISAAPFHMWTPDVYEGAPSSVTAFFAMVPKLAAIGLLMRLLFVPFDAATEQWIQIIYFLSLLSMIVGAFAALVQTDIKRLLAYGSIANIGYALIGLVAATPEGAGSVVLYMFIYMIATAGVFAILISMRRGGRAFTKIEDLAGLSKTAPAMAYAMLILMFSMAGIPPMAGFFGKLLVFNAAVDQGYYILATVGVVTSVVAAFYYLKIVKVMFFDEAADAFDGGIPLARRIILFVSVLFAVAFIFKPAVFVENSVNAASALFTE